jgi:N-acetylneuraminic acid mutarotase
MSSKKEKSSSKLSKAAEKALRKEEKKKKQELKTEKSQKKKEAKELEGEEDISKTVARLLKKKESGSKPATVVACSQPGPRSNFSLVQSPISDELIMFGGQYYDGQTQHVYGETYRWHFQKNEWRLVESVPSPNPRSCHQAVVHKHHMYVFGGEYSTIRQFYHFRDMWRFDLKTNTWEELRCSGPSPSPRSGHRMVVWKHFIVLFGGFHDTFRDCKYFSDLYLFNIPEERWEKIDVSTISVPSPRSGCGFFMHPSQDLAFVYGGYVRDKKVSGTELCDMWQLSLRLQPGMAVPVKAVWERLSKKGTAPSKRSGASFATHKGRALVFGGVFDKDTQGLTMESEFFNELYAFDMDRKRWYVLDYNLPKQSGRSREQRKNLRKLQQQDDQDKDMMTPCGEDDGPVLGKFQWIFEYVDEHGNPAQMIVDDTEAALNQEVVHPETIPVDIPVPKSPETPIVKAPEVVAPIQTPTAVVGAEFELPTERMGASMFVVGNTLAVFGGMSEIKDKEITFDDCWTLDLNARDKWINKIQGTMDQQEWLGEDSESDSDDEFDYNEDFDDDDDDYTSSGSSDDEEEGSDEEESDKKSVPEPVVTEKKKSGGSLKDKMARIRQDHDLDERYTPLVGESLKDFFARTQAHWSTQVVEDILKKGDQVASYERVDINDKKEVRRIAFALAGTRFEATSAVLAKLKEYEEEQTQLEQSMQRKKKSSSK